MSDAQLCRSPIEAFIPLVAGGVGGTTGAIFTCPLEVVKTRLQSSNSGFPTSQEVFVGGKNFTGKTTTGGPPCSGPASTSDRVLTSARALAVNVRLSPQEIAAEKRTGLVQTSIPIVSCDRLSTSASGRLQPVLSFHQRRMCVRHVSTATSPNHSHQRMNVFQCLRFIYVTEGVFGLFKGLGPNLMGVAPSRAIYFWAYSTAKKKINAALPRANRDTPFVHVASAMSAGFSASTTTNPIWLIKTRLQLDRSRGKNILNIRKCCKLIYSERGLLGFWRGVTASYWGISETVIHFVIYEALKKRLEAYKRNNLNASCTTTADVFGYMLCGACSKTCATCIAYPHEVARTRLREQGDRYRSFWQTLKVVYREEGRRGLYRGLGTQLVRQIPNTAIVMSTYELTVTLLTRWLRSRQISSVSPSSSPSLTPSSSTLACDLKNAAYDTNSNASASGSRSSTVR